MSVKTKIAVPKAVMSENVKFLKAVTGRCCFRMESNDVEALPVGFEINYLFVEGVYNTGNKDWINSRLSNYTGPDVDKYNKKMQIVFNNASYDGICEKGSEKYHQFVPAGKFAHSPNNGEAVRTTLRLPCKAVLQIIE